MSSEHSPFVLHAFIRLILNIALVWFLATYLHSYFTMSGGWPAVIVVGILITILNVIVRPVLAVITLPFKLFASILAIIIVNGVFVQLVFMIVERMDAGLVTLEINGGIWGWTVVAIILGVGNWMMKAVMK